MGERIGSILQTVGIFWIVILLVMHHLILGAYQEFLIEDNVYKQIAVPIVDIIFSIPGIFMIVLGRKQLKK